MSNHSLICVCTCYQQLLISLQFNTSLLCFWCCFSVVYIKFCHLSGKQFHLATPPILVKWNNVKWSVSNVNKYLLYPSRCLCQKLMRMFNNSWTSLFVLGLISTSLYMRFKYFPYGIQRGNPTWPRTSHVNKVSHEFELNKFFDFWTRFFFFCFFCFCFCFFLVFSFSEPSRMNSVDFMNFLMPELNSRTSSRVNFSTLSTDLPKDYL